MPAVPNSLIRNQCESVVINAIEIGNIIDCNFSESGANYGNRSSGNIYSKYGGALSADVSGTIQTTDFTANQIRAGLLVETLNATFSGMGASSSNYLNISLASSAKARIKSITTGDYEGSRSWTIDFDIFSGDGVTHPLVVLYQ